MKKNVFRCMILAALLTGLTGCQKSDNDSEWKKEDKLLEDEQTEATSQDEMTSESQEDEDTTSTDVEASLGMEMNQLDLSGYTFHNDEALNEVIKYTNENIVDDLLDGGQHFKSHIARKILEKDGYVGFDEQLLEVFCNDLITTAFDANVVYVSDAEDMGDYYRIGICTVREEDDYRGNEYYYCDNNYLAFYASIFKEGGEYYILPFDYKDADLYAPVFGCAKGQAATGAQLIVAKNYLFERMSNEAACQDTHRDLFAERLAEMEAYGHEQQEQGYVDYYNNPGTYSQDDTSEIFFEEPPVAVY